MFACLHAPGNSLLLMECAAHFSPLIEETSPDTVVFDIRGLRSLYGSATQLAEEIRRRAGIEANLAIAVNPDAAVHAARGIPGITMLPPKRAAGILSPLPLYLLGGSPGFAHTLDLWGVRTFGEFASLPPAGVAARLAEEGVQFQKLARGAGRRQLRLSEAPLTFIEEMDLDHALDSLEPLQFLLSHMLEKLCARLRFHARSTNEIRLRLKLERTADHCTTLRTPVPILNTKILLKLLYLQLRAKPPQAPVEKICVEMMPVRPRTTQHGLFLPSAPEPENLEITLAKIRSLVGAANVGAPELIDTHRADVFRMTPLRILTHPAVTRMHPGMALRRFRPPCPAQVWCADGKPIRIFSSAGGGRVVAFAGPWRSSGDWWGLTDWDREEWDIEIQNVSLSRIYQDHDREWFMAGNYD